MLRKRPDPDPFAERKRQLAEQERRLAERMSQLNQELYEGDAPEPEPVAPELPVWRLGEETPVYREPELTPARRRSLARQRQRDMLFFFVCFGFCVLAALIVLWIFYVHYRGPYNGA